MAVQLAHEALAEGHNFPVGLALGIEIRAALAATDGQAGQGILENLFEAQEFDDAQVDGGMEAQPALVGADGTVELDAEAAVDLHLALVVHPRHAEHHHALRLGQTLEKASLLKLGIGLDHRAQGVEHLGGRLDEFVLGGVLADKLGENGIDIGHRVRLLFISRLPKPMAPASVNIITN